MTANSSVIFIQPAEEGLRIDRLLSEHFPDYSRTYFQNIIKQGAVLVNGKQVVKRILVHEKDKIEIFFQEIPGPSLAADPIPLNILYEDDHLLAVNKPDGMVVHPAPGHWSKTFVNALLAHCNTPLPGNDPLRPGIVHRLDKDTSGILLAAKTRVAHKKLIEMFSNRRIEKLYLSICCGRLTRGLVQAPIGRHPVHRKKMAVLNDGREAMTEFQLLACNDKLSFILARPFTGRTHQIRVHLHHIGTPVLGDKVYGSEYLNQIFDPKRQLLHAYRLSFQHPITGDFLKLSAPIPEDMQFWMKYLSAPTPCEAATISS